MKLNKNFELIKDNYLFHTIALKTEAFKKENPTADIIRLGIGDVVLPLTPHIVDAAKKAADEMASIETFKGYGPYRGYDFLLNAIVQYYQDNFKVDIEPDEVFTSCGAKNDIAAILELFDVSNTVLIPDPVYPAYVGANIMDGRKIIYMNGTKENNFLPLPSDKTKGDIIYLCSPNNPTGAVYTREQLKQWVDFAIKNDSVILFDSAYEYFITEDLPRSIYEIEGAKKCAIEVCSLSKTAGFTGVRFGHTIVPKELKDLNNRWFIRQSSKHNGVSIIVQRMAEAVFSKQGQKEAKQNVAIYQENANLMKKTLKDLGIYSTGGTNCPFVWFECGKDSWKFFDNLLNNAHIIGTPGAGFGQNGEGFFRFSSFNTPENTQKAMDRFKKFLKR
ncbi:MAG: LL-diaminopimelate aminotransferase [Firmicutes bacterium]|nr:LL-diaminopimelate aminotransferase [Bacillota bacterium]